MWGHACQVGVLSAWESQASEAISQPGNLVALVRQNLCGGLKARLGSDSGIATFFP